MTHPYDSGQGSSHDPSRPPEQGGSSEHSGYPGYDQGGQGGYPGGQAPQYGTGPPDYGQAGGYPGYPGYPGYGPPLQELPKGLAIAALVLGILALVTFWTAVGGIVLGIVGVILGGVAIRKAGRGQAGGRGMAIAGLVLSVLGLLGGILFAVLYAFAVSMFGQAIQECQQYQGNPQRFRQCLLENSPAGPPQSFDVGASHVTIRS